MSEQHGETWDPRHLRIARLGGDAIRQYGEAGTLRLRLAGADLRGRDLSHAPMGDADLRGANLQDANLYGAYLVRANLRGANLHSANLGRANLAAAQVQSAHLMMVDFTGATLEGADLSDADLSCANLYSVVLRGAVLARVQLRFATLGSPIPEGTDLAGSTFGGTRIATDLTSAAGLDYVFHAGPSHIAHDVLLRPTRRPWPIQFLRGCGLTNAEVEFVSTLSRVAVSFYSVFISYSTKDDAFAVRLHDALQAKGIRCWLDKHEILPGDNIYAKVDEGIRLWDKVLLCCSKGSLTSWWVKDEVTRGLEKEQKLEKERGHEVLSIVPLDLDGFLFDDACQLEYAPTLRKRHAAKFAGWKDDPKVFDAQLERVVKAMRADDLARPKPPPPKL